MEKQASINDFADTVGQLTVNPAVRSALLGTGAYFGSKWLYNKAADRMAKRYFNQIQDPKERANEMAAFQERKKKMQPWVTVPATLVGAGIPLIGTMGPYKAGLAHDWGQGSSMWNALMNNQMDAYKNLWKGGMEKNSGNYMDTNAPYTSLGSADDLLLGKDFTLPAVRPLTFWNIEDIPKHQSIDLLQTQEPLLGLNNTYALVNGLQLAGDERRSGLISAKDIFKGMIRAGIGAWEGKVAADVLGTIMAQPAGVKDKMRQYGMIGGAILNSGILTELG